MQWYLYFDKKQRGPFTTEQVKVILKDNYGVNFCWCWREGFTDWRPVHEVTEIWLQKKNGSPYPTPKVFEDKPTRLPLKETKSPIKNKSKTIQNSNLKNTEQSSTNKKSGQDKVWWYATRDQKFGPYSASELKAMANSGEVVATDLVWKDGLTKWVIASSIKGLIQKQASLTEEPKAPEEKHTNKIHNSNFKNSKNDIVFKALKALVVLIVLISIFNFYDIKIVKDSLIIFNKSLTILFSTFLAIITPVIVILLLIKLIKKIKIIGQFSVNKKTKLVINYIKKLFTFLGSTIGAINSRINDLLLNKRFSNFEISLVKMFIIGILLSAINPGFIFLAAIPYFYFLNFKENHEAFGPEDTKNDSSKKRNNGTNISVGKCKYCGTGIIAGAPCPKSPTGGHVITGIKKKCIYCVTGIIPGAPCPRSPTGGHVIDVGPNKCIYCVTGIIAGAPCPRSPSGGHVLGGGIM